MSECVHPFHQVTAIAISGTENKKNADFIIHFRCGICGQIMTMASVGHVAQEGEREQVEALHGKPDDGFQLGYG